MNKRKQIISENEISRMVEWNLSGYPQKVLLEGRRKELPVVICLHGGPGTPIPFNAGCRGLFPELTNRFIMVYWDQLGCGINNRPMKDIFSLERMVEMTRELVLEVRKLFPHNPICLLSISWGTVLSALAAEKLGDELTGVVASGQVVKDLIFNPHTAKLLESPEIPVKQREKLRGIRKETAQAPDFQRIMSSLQKYTVGYMNPGDQAKSLPLILGMLRSPDYSLRDFMAIVKNGYTGLDTPIRTLLDVNLEAQLQNVKVPYRIFQGQTDGITPAALVKEVVEKAGTPLLSWEMIPDSGHFFGPRVMEALTAALEALTN